MGWHNNRPKKEGFRGAAVPAADGALRGEPEARGSEMPLAGQRAPGGPARGHSETRQEARASGFHILRP